MFMSCENTNAEYNKSTNEKKKFTFPERCSQGNNIYPIRIGVARGNRFSTKSCQPIREPVFNRSNTDAVTSLQIHGYCVGFRAMIKFLLCFFVL